jgi:hypothetical protein
MEVLTMKRIAALLTVFAMIAVIGALYVQAANEGKWTGEVIDVACHSSKGAKGTGHAECGAKCVKEGLPVGLLVGDTTYLLISSDHKPLNATLAEHVGHTVDVTGEKYESPGANVIAVKDWKMSAK